VEFIGSYIRENDLAMRIAIEPKPKEPRGDISLSSVGHVLAFIATLDEPVRETVGVDCHGTGHGLELAVGRNRAAVRDGHPEASRSASV
jgi:hypothetical protein